MKAALSFALLFWILVAPAQAIFDKDGEHIIVSGGPALREWENFRVEAQRHDFWWGNFARAARVKMQELRAENGPKARITWLVYRKAYEKRGKEDNTDYVSHVISIRDREDVRCKLVWFETKEQLINYLNSGMNRADFKIKSFDFFGHSNKYCFAFDYSGEILGASKCFLHQDDLKLLNRGIFARGAKNQSWGCHTGEAMSAAWRRTTGTRLRGAVGKTDYANCWVNDGTLPVVSPGGRWTTG
ncbi:MAG: hypothetical protein ACI8UO_006126 [Verrucomicrobiales bacterium]|jgi:hypothetical protein